jgi:integrase
MMPRQRQSRIYWRARGGSRRAYADFRDYGDAGGRLEPLVPPGEKRATTDPDVAQVLLARRLEQLEERRRSTVLGPAPVRVMLRTFAREHLIAKKRAGATTDRWLGTAQRHLERAVAFFGAERDLATIRTEDVRRWIERLQSVESRKGGTLTGGTIRHHLNSLSNLYRRAQAEGHVLPGFNPAAALMEKPSARRQEAKWLEVPDAAILLEAARTATLRRADLALPFLYELLATYLLTGGRREEVLALQVGDINFERRTVTFRPNAWRRLKTDTSWRVVPLWPQLEAILRAYLNRRTAAEALGDEPTSPLLFPGQGPARRGQPRRVADFRKALAQVTARLEWRPGEVTPKVFRHTYCAARLQTLDRGAPVSIFTVGRELGHGGDALVRRIYGHLGDFRHRAEVVEYRVEQFPHLAERVERLAFVTAIVTVGESESRKSLSRP